jgi:hypothetical protein
MCEVDEIDPSADAAGWHVCLARASDHGLTGAENRDALHQMEPLWDQLFPAEQARIVRLLVHIVGGQVQRSAATAGNDLQPRHTLDRSVQKARRTILLFNTIRGVPGQLRQDSHRQVTVGKQARSAPPLGPVSA